jgi:hypothetical protein
MGRIGRDLVFAAALIVSFQFIVLPPAGRAASLVVAQADSTAAPGKAPAADSNGAPGKSPPETPAVAEPASKPAEPTSRLKAAKAVLAVPACSIRYAAAKVEGKLAGRKWSDFRREECGEKETQAVFPNAIAPKYSGETPDRGRTLTCADQFTANKATNGNGSLKWIDKDGGYYAECISRLKG